MIERNSKGKILFVFSCFGVLFFFVIGKAFKVQVVDRNKLLKRSKDQVFREIKVYPKRGNIYDRNGRPLALNVQTYSIFTMPKQLKGSSSIYKKLSRIVPELSYKKILKKVKNRTRYTWLARKIPLKKDQVKAIKALKGIYIDSVPKRIYPNNEVASQIIGFVGVDNVGLSGVEYRFDKELKGRPKVVKYVKDAKGRPVKFESQEIRSKNFDLYLSIDKELQATAEKYLKEVVVLRKATRGGIGIIDASQGEILAMANYPTFDPNNLKISKPEDRKLAFVTDPIEPGSTFKTFTIASALENKIANPDTSYYCERGRLKVEDHTISEAESKEDYEWLSVTEILKYSSNIGVTKIAFDLTYPKLKKTIKKFQFGKRTGIEVPGESRGIFNESENVSPLSLSNISFGQGVATTGIQMLAAYAAIANRGNYYPPTLIRGGNENRKPMRIISESTAKKLESMLVDAVDSGTGDQAKLKLFKIAGKTSTAQRVDSKGGYKGYVSGFIGFPVNIDRKYVIYVYIDNPQDHYYGNVVAGPVFRKVAEYILYKNREFSKLAVSSEKANLGNVDTVEIKQSSTRDFGEGKVPKFMGLDKKSAMYLAEKFDINLVQKGMGVVIKQVPLPGDALRDNGLVKLFYAPPSYE